MKTSIQCVEKPEVLGGVIIYDQVTFAMNKQHLVAVLDHKASFYNCTSKQNLGLEGEKLLHTSSVVTASEDKKDECLE